MGAFNPAVAIGEFQPGAGASVTASQPPSIPNPTAPGGLSAFEGLLIFAPVILYGLFTVYRSTVNERAKVICNTLVVAHYVVWLSESRLLFLLHPSLLCQVC